MFVLTLPELLEDIFVFLNRKNLYRSCTRVNHQWNAISMRVIQKKRKAEFIKIPSIRDNILFHLYKDRPNLTEFINYCYVSKIWSNILNHLREKDHILISLKTYNWFLNSSYRNRTRNRRKHLLHNKRQLIFFMDSCSHHCLKHDREINRYYQDILSQYNIKAEFLRLSRVCRSYDYMSNTEDEFRRLAKSFRSIRH